jgi:hypothetical protein
MNVPTDEQTASKSERNSSPSSLSLSLSLSPLLSCRVFVSFSFFFLQLILDGVALSVRSQTPQTEQDKGKQASKQTSSSKGEPKKNK